MQTTYEKEAAGAVDVTGEFAALRLGDDRLNARAKKIAAAMAAQPSASLPNALVRPAELEGCYRLLSNQAVTPEKLLSPHIKQTRLRCCKQKLVLAIADTTSMQFNGEQTREGLGPITQHGKGHGFRHHPTLAVSFDDGPQDILGILANHVWARDPHLPSADKLYKIRQITRQEARARRTEEQRWWTNAQTVEQEKLPGVQIVHVMDREADSYELLAQMQAADYRFVFRMQFNRKATLEGADGQYSCLKKLAKDFSVYCKREVELSARGANQHRHPVRRSRATTLALSAGQVCVTRPGSTEQSLPSVLTLNLVRAWESNPPEGEQPIEWFLLTSESIETIKDIESVVDIYRSRWIIEEFFCAIEAGCAYETRQLESLTTLSNALAFTLPIAWQLLRLKFLARIDASQPATQVFTAEQLYVLRLSAERPVSEAPTVGEVMMAIAGLGGHLKRNGDPGWRILARGYFDLTRRVLGFRLPRCDQS